ncbi:MAG: mechanosensitive ion channel family protein [Dehalococcoidia bacterium]|jgi:small-conductance mechanosensitive channel|nr:mechanosensitive ion channel family protein [Dehalococcoidia bacterium]MDP6226235.1 mechanosensitive ion channel family protein [Dehalococcoidia bacterium]HJN88363.1 mechanosensitive ion channel family protein [Dehalococcoidia bacterium]
MNFILVRFGLGDPTWLDPATAVGIALISLIAAVVFHKLLFRLVLRLTQWTPSDLDSRMVRATRWPITLGIIVLGVYLAIIIPLDLSAEQRDTADTIAGLLGIFLGILVVTASVSNGLDWYLENLTRTQHVVDLRMFPLLRRFTVSLIYGLGALLILDLLDINISPLIAGLGLGGLAIALAIQPTLANLFAGTYVMTEGVVAPGDFIELQGGVTGYVVEVGWRSTRIRTWRNNLVVVPNGKFAETIITNYQRPVPAVNVYLSCGVSYDSDLYEVERVCREVMDEVLEAEPSAVKEYGGWFGFDNFGDSNVNFWLFLQARDRLGSFTVQSILIQKLHQRLRENGMVINYPMRSLQLPKGLCLETSTARVEGEPAGRPPAGRVRGRRRRRRPPRELHVSLEADGEPDGDGDVGSP